MEKMNLSRLHSNIKTESGLINDMARRLASVPLVKSMRIFEKTGQKDMDAFAAGCHMARKNFLSAMETIIRHEQYLAYLKAELEKANRRAHVGEALLESSAKQRHIMRLASIRDVLAGARQNVAVSPEALVPFEDIKDVDVYKSTYTENNRIYDLGVEIFGQPELDKIENRIAEAEKQHRQIMDRLAAINQKTFVNIMDFEEFSASAEKAAG